MEKRPSKAVLAVCAEIEGDGSRDNIEQTVYAAEQILDLRKMVALAEKVISRSSEAGTADGSQFVAFAKRTAARSKRSGV